MNYIEARKYIDDSARFSMKLGLNRTEKILEILGNPHKKIKCIHVAGTNGKGSTTAMVTSILKEAGYKVGMYTSPYIEEFEERIQINGICIEKEELAQSITKISLAVDKVLELGYDNPTQFEIITCAAFLHFYNKGVDFAVVEVGLGGRLDSTNVIKPILSIITSISYDHMNILGDTISKIAAEKGGIIKEGVPVVLYPQNEEAEKVIEDICKIKKSQIIKLEKDSAKFLKCYRDEKGIFQNIDVKGHTKTYNINLSLLGKHQLMNCATAINAIEALRKYKINIDDECINRALSKVKWPGRFEIMKEHPIVIIDGAHNIDGINKLKESLENYVEYHELVLVLGILADKQVEEMVKVITPLAKKVICVTPNNERAELAEELKLEVEKYNSNCEAVNDYEEAYIKGIKACGENDLLLISGSLYMIGDMRKKIKKYVD